MKSAPIYPLNYVGKLWDSARNVSGAVSGPIGEDRWRYVSDTWGIEFSDDYPVAVVKFPRGSRPRTRQIENVRRAIQRGLEAKQRGEIPGVVS